MGAKELFESLEGNLVEAFRRQDADHANKKTEISNTNQLVHLYGVLAQAKFAEAFEGWHEDCEFTFLGSPLAPFVGNWRGRDLVMTVVGRNFAQLDGTALDIEYFLSQGELIAIEGREEGVTSLTGHQYEARWLHIFQFEEGKILRMIEVVDAAMFMRALRRFSLSPSVRALALQFEPSEPTTEEGISQTYWTAYRHLDPLADSKTRETRNVAQLIEWTQCAHRRNVAGMESLLAEEAELAILAEKDFPATGRWVGRRKVVEQFLNSDFDLCPARCEGLILIAQGSVILTLQKETGHCSAASRSFQTWSVQITTWSEPVSPEVKPVMEKIDRWYDSWSIGAIWNSMASR